MPQRTTMLCNVVRRTARKEAPVWYCIDGYNAEVIFFWPYDLKICVLSVIVAQQKHDLEVASGNPPTEST